MNPQKYRKKPVVIEALIWNGGNAGQMRQFVNDPLEHKLNFAKGQLRINTLEGTMFANVGDYIIKGVQGEFYPCKPDIFEESYEPVKVEVEG